jgi:O-acetyl-ADP-ribose deacetylase
VGPVWNGGNSNEVALLGAAYTSSLKLAVEHGVRTIAFPNISTGIYRFPKDMAARIAVDAVSKFLADSDAVEKVVFVCFDVENYGLYRRLLKADRSQH